MKTLRYYIMIMMGLCSLFPFVGSAQNQSGWQCDIYQYEYDMTVYGSLEKNGQPVTNAELAAFVGDECRGIAELQTVGTQSYYYLRVRSNQEKGESIFLRVFLDEAETTLSATFSFQSQEQLGYPSQPLVWSLPAILDPSEEHPFQQVTEETTEVTVGTGTLDGEKLAELNQQLTGGAGENKSSQVEKLDLSQTTIASDDQSALKNLLSGKEFLTSVDLPKSVITPETQKSDLIEKENSNPNTMLLIPHSVENTTLKETPNVIVKKEDQSLEVNTIELTGEHPFQLPEAVKVTETISLQHSTPKVTTTPQTYWGTVCLPFVPTRYQFVPTTVRSGEMDPSVIFYKLVENDKQFVEVKVTELKANTPYLYKTLGQGTIQFESTEPQSLPKTETEYVVQGDGFEFVGTYKPVESSEQVFALQVGHGAFEQGSGDVQPFQAYIRPITSAADEKLEIDIAIPVTGLSIVGASEVEVGKSLQLGISYTPSNTTQTGLVWSSSDETIASVDAVGKVTAKKEGKVTITVESKENSSVKATLDLTVKAKAVDPTPDPGPGPTPTPDPDPTPGGPDVPVVPGGPDTPDTPNVPVTPEIPNPVVEERSETTATVTWVKVADAVRYVLNLYADAQKQELLRSYELDQDGNLLRASSLSFLLTDLDPNQSYYVETVAYGKNDKVLVTKAATLSAYDPTATEAVEASVETRVGKGVIQLQLAVPTQIQVVSLSGAMLYQADQVDGTLRIAVPQAGWYLLIWKQGDQTGVKKLVVPAM